MAKPNKILIEKLREAATNIDNGADYNWGHIGKCNCGHLLRTVKPMTSSEVYKKAHIQKLDEWSEFANDYCPENGASIDTMVDELLGVGLELSDINHLEHLSDKHVLQALPGGFRYLEKGKKENAVSYMRTWANLLESSLVG
jgi:hypothetical protein